MTQTLSEKVWEQHVVHRADGEPDLLYIDLHLVHEVTSPQAFDGLRLNGRARAPARAHRRDDGPQRADDRPRARHHRPDLARKQIETLAPNCAEFGIRLYGMGDPGQGIVHVIGPEQGLTQPGMTIVCGDSHTSTHGAFGALAFGIGTSEVEHVLATQTLPQQTPGTMAVTVDGDLPAGVTAKDVVLSIIAQIGTGGGIGSVIEYRGSAIRALSMEGRMTVCNMSIEAGARAGLIAPDDTTFAYLEGRPFAPKGAAWEQALDAWRALPTDAGATFDKEVDRSTRRRCAPSVSWGTNPAQTTTIDAVVPDPASFTDEGQQESATRALQYMGLKAGTPIRDINVDTVFIGSCTELARRGPAGRGGRSCAGRTVQVGDAGDGRARLVRGEGGGRGRGARRDLHRGRASSGASRAARCAWR